jgi:hypothetical protein
MVQHRPSDVGRGAVTVDLGRPVGAGMWHVAIVSIPQLTDTRAFRMLFVCNAFFLGERVILVAAALGKASHAYLSSQAPRT